MTKAELKKELDEKKEVLYWARECFIALGHDLYLLSEGLDNVNKKDLGETVMALDDIKSFLLAYVDGLDAIRLIMDKVTPERVGFLPKDDEAAEAIMALMEKKVVD